MWNRIAPLLRSEAPRLSGTKIGRPKNGTLHLLQFQASEEESNNKTEEKNERI